MYSNSKLFGRNFAKASSNVDLKEKEQHDTDEKVNESLENLIKQTIGKEPFFSFTKAADSPLQWIRWLDSWDKVVTGSKVESRADAKINKQTESCESERIMTNIHGVKDLVHNMKNDGFQASGERLHSLTIPEAVVAFAQAAAKANDLPRWPLISPKSLQKCDKCLQEFCSPLNYRRHVRMHRRPFNVDMEDLRKVRSQVAEFWDKLSMDEVDQIVSFKNMMLEDLCGSSIVKSLPSFLQQRGSSFYYQSYLKAGTTLLEIVQNKMSKLLLSRDLFNVLDDSSEKTFLCGVLSFSMQRFIFQGEAGKTGLESRNLVASLGLLVEQRLVKAWMAERDEEALRCQKALVEEEEAAQKKQAKLQERKRLKKIRQKESKEKERKDAELLLKSLEFDSFDRGSEACYAGVDDSPSSTHSISSDYSTENHHLESHLMDIDDEFAAVANDRDDTIFKSIDEDILQGVDGQQTNPGFEMEQIISFENASTGQAAIIQPCDQEIKQQTEMHSGQNNENLKLLVPFKTMVHCVSEQNVKFAWRDRRCGLNYGAANYQRPLYGSEQRSFDGIICQARRTAREPCSMPWAETHDYSSVSLLNKPFIASSCRHYNDRLLSFRRNTANIRSPHVVWAKKIQSNPGIQPDNVSSINESSNSGDVIIESSMTFSENHVKDGNVLTEDESVFRIRGLGSVVLSHFNEYNTSVTNCEQSSITSNLENSDICLSCDCCISSESSSCQSLANIPTKGAEDETEDKEVSLITHESDADGTSCLSWQSVKDQPEVSYSNCALFVGSLSIPLEACEGSSHEKLKRLSRDFQHSPGKKQRGEIATSCGSCFLDVAKGKQESKNLMNFSCKISEEGKVTHKISASGQLGSQENSACLLKIMTGDEGIINRHYLPNGENRTCSSTKVRQHVGTIGELPEASINECSLPCARKEGLPLLDNPSQADSNNLFLSRPVKDERKLCNSCLVENQQEHENVIKIYNGLPSEKVSGPSSGVAVKPEAFGILSVLNKNVANMPTNLKTTNETHITERWKGDKLESLIKFLSKRWADAVAPFQR